MKTARAGSARRASALGAPGSRGVLGSRVARACVFAAAMLAACVLGSPVARAEPVCIDLAGGAVHRYEAEIAATPGARAQGLMFRRALAPGAGMLFDFGRDEVARMWMKNTFIPLDMVFADRDGTVRRIVRNARPRSLDTISSRVPVRAVLELNGGETERIGLAAGDRLRHPVFGTRCDN